MNPSMPSYPGAAGPTVSPVTVRPFSAFVLRCDHVYISLYFCCVCKCKPTLKLKKKSHEKKFG